ncbi:MAG: branched-chain amino acid ABC transporter permease [Rhodospirillales bacterium]
MTAIIVQLIIGGVLLGGLYTLVAFGLSLIYGVVRILNFAHGTLLAISGIAASVLFAAYGINPGLIAILLVPAFLVFGYFLYTLLLEPLKKRNPMEATVGTVLVTVGVLLIISDVAALIAGPTTKNIPLEVAIYEVGGVIIQRSELFVLGGIAAFTVALHFFLKHTWFGRAIRAVTQDPLGASICGIRSRSIHAYTVAFGCGIVAVAGVLYTLKFPVDPYGGFDLTVKAFTIIILGGIGNLVGALFAGIFLGLAETLAGFYWASEWAPGVSIMLLLAILILFPRGLASVRK